MSKFLRKFSQNWKKAKFWVNYLTPKMNITFFIINWILSNYNFFRKGSISWGNCKELFWGRIWPLFREKDSSRRWSRLTSTSTSTICCFQLCGQEFPETAYTFNESWAEQKRTCLGECTLPCVRHSYWWDFSFIEVI